VLDEHHLAHADLGDGRERDGDVLLGLALGHRDAGLAVQAQAQALVLPSTASRAVRVRAWGSTRAPTRATRAFQTFSG
jgi:hypothetical protein